jgi:hypothetical protein
MQYLIYSGLFILVYLYLGLGLTLLICPENIKKYALILSPLIGYCYLTLFGWYAYSLEIKGTDAYAVWVLLLPAIFLYFGWRRLGDTKKVTTLFDKQLIAPILAGAVLFLLISAPFFLKFSGLTSFMSLGNHDIADSASVASFLKGFARSATIGFVGQSPMAFKAQADQTIFGGPLATAFTASLFRLETYQLQTLSVHVFFFLGILTFWAWSRHVFQYNETAAIGLVLLYGLNVMTQYSIYESFQGQIITVGLTLAFFLVQHEVIFNHLKTSDTYRYILMTILLVWGISLTYNHMLPILYAILFICALVHALQEKRMSAFFHWLLLSGVSLFIVFLLSPYRAKAIFELFLQRGRDLVGWFIPWQSPDTIFGLGIKNAYLHPHSNTPRILLSVLIALIVGWGLLAVKKEKHVFWSAIIFLSSVTAGYLALCLMGHTREGWGGYKSFKWISFFIPFVLASSLLIFRHVQLSFSDRKNILLLFLGIMLIGFNLYSAYFMQRQIQNVSRAVSRDLTDLKIIDKRADVQSINILGQDTWEILWATNFLLSKKLYFQTSTYGGREASELHGDWDLLKQNTNALNLSEVHAGEFIPINSTYVLKRK